MRTRYTVAAYASAVIGALIAAAFWLWMTNHEGRRGERLPGVLCLYMALLLASAAAGCAALFSILGIRSWRSAGTILPGALVGIAVNGFNAFWCILAFALEGKNLGG